MTRKIPWYAQNGSARLAFYTSLVWILVGGLYLGLALGGVVPGEGWFVGVLWLISSLFFVGIGIARLQYEKKQPTS